MQSDAAIEVEPLALNLALTLLDKGDVGVDFLDAYVEAT